MSSYKYILIGLVFSLFLQCDKTDIVGSRGDCPVDGEVSKHFDNWLSLIYVNHANRAVNFTDLTLAYEAIERVTGLESRAQIGNDTYIYYLNEDDFLLDIRNWTDWYNDNRCFLKMRDLLDILKKESIEFPDYGSAEVVEYLRVRYPELSSQEAAEVDSISRVEFAKGLPDMIKPLE